MNLNTVKEALPYLFKAKMVGNLIGVHGVGKSTLVREYCEENKIGFIDLRLGQMEVGDLLGLPEIHTDKKGDKITVFARPKWFPTEGEGVLFLDEWNRSKRDVTQAIFQLILDRKLHDYVLPEGWNVVAAMNPGNGDDYVTLDLSDKALMDRFLHIKISSNYQDFLNYANIKGFNRSVNNFISAHPAMLRGETQEFNLNFVTPSDRSWERAGRLITMYDKGEMPEAMLNELLVGLVGLEASTAFSSWKKTDEKPVAGEQVLKNYKKVRDVILKQVDETNYRPDLLNETKQELFRILQEKGEDSEIPVKQYDNLVAFMNDLPDDLFVDAVNQLVKTPKTFLKAADDPKITEKIDRCVAKKEESQKTLEVDKKQEQEVVK